MALRFPVYIHQIEGHSVGLTPALPGLTHRAKSKKDVIQFITNALCEALIDQLEPRGFPVDIDQIESGSELVYLTLDEPTDWWYADPSE
tara:strand:- start:128 stop:394 length:267 start_codon:yes stop_codon:yes gene_type:complete